jgi:uncharacterized membrane protein YphA (DoxX/SURF4 family)
MALDTGVGAVALLVARLLFGGVLAFSGLNHFLNTAELAEAAAAKGVPAARLGVVTSGTTFVLGGVGLLLGAYPVLAAGTLATTLLVITPAMHDFWAVPDAETETELTQFLKNTALFGASLVFLALGDQAWGFAVGVGLWP